MAEHHLFFQIRSVKWPAVFTDSIQNYIASACGRAVITHSAYKERICSSFRNNPLSLCLSLSLCLCLSLSVSACLSVCLSACLCLSVCLPVCLSACLSVVCLSLSLSLSIQKSIRQELEIRYKDKLSLN